MLKTVVRAWATCMLAAVFALGALAGCAFADTDSQPEEGTSIVSEDAGFGLSSFERMQVGVNKTYLNTYYGYAYSQGKGTEDNVTLLCLDDRILVYIPQTVLEASGLDLNDPNATAIFQQLVEELDDGASNGGPSLNRVKGKLPYEYTTDKSVKIGDISIEFSKELEENYYYTIIKKKGLDNNRGLASFCDSFQLLPADQVVVASAGGWFEQLKAFLGKVDYRPLWVSLKTAAVAMIFIFIFGLIAAWRSMHVKSRWKSLLDSLFTIPMVLPPTVCGFLLLLVFGKSTALGRFFIDHGLDLVFTWPAAVIAAVVVGFPLMYRTVLGAFEALDVNMLDAARTLGWSETRIFSKLMLPLAWPSIAAGMVLAFARAMGEFGATLFFAGNYAGVTQTMPIAIYFNWMGGSTDVAIFWVVVVIVISFLIIMIINLYSAHVQKFRVQGASGIDEDMGFSGDVPQPVRAEEPAQERGEKGEER